MSITYTLYFYKRRRRRSTGKLPIEERTASTGFPPPPPEKGCENLTREDTDRLFELFRLFRPGDPKVDNKRLHAAWALVLEPYEVDDVRRAVADYFRGNSFFPDVTDIATRCQRQPAPLTAEWDTPASMQATQEQRQKELEAWQQEWHQELRERGLPSMREALGQGMSIAQWNAMLKESGVWD